MKKITLDRLIWRTLLALVLVLSFQSGTLALVEHPQVDSPQLEPGKTVERKTVGGESHTYRIKLTAGQYLRVAVEQNGIDVSLTLTAPDDQQVVTLNLIRPGGVESLAAEVKSDGDYRLTVRGAGAPSSSGSYVLRLETRAPTVEDRKRIEAQSLALRAKQLISQGRGSAPPVIEASEQALEIWRALNDQQMIASSLIEIAGAHFLLGHQDKASDFARQAVTVARSARDRGGEEYALYLLGNIASSLNQHEQAIQNNEQALQIAREIKDRYYEALLLSQIGFANYNLGRYQKASEYYEQTLRLNREDKDRRGEGVTRVRLGQVYMGLSQSEKAIELIDPAVEIFRTLKDRQREGVALSNLGAAHSYLGHYDKASEILQQTLVIAREIKNQNLEGNALLTLTSIQASLGRYETAIEFNESALRLTGETRDRILAARLLLQRSNLFLLLNRIDKAIDSAEQALKINRETKYLNGQGDALSVLGDAHARQEHYDKAIEYYEQSLSIRRELKDQEGVSLSLSNMAEIYVGLGQAEKAVPYYEEALKIGRDIKLPTRQAAALAGLGEAYRKLGQFDKAAELLTQALTINRELRRRPNEASNLYYLALAERARGNLTSARSNVAESLKITESIRTELLSPDARASLLAEGQDAYRLHIDLLMRGNGAGPSVAESTLAFQVSERQRARSLLDLLSEARADVRQGVDASVLDRERKLASQLNARAASQVQLLSHSHTPEQAAELKQEIDQLENDYERVQAEIRRVSPGYAALTQPQPLALKEIQQQLDPDTLLLEYSLGSESSYVWAVTRDSINSFELGPEKKITEAAKSLYNLMTTRSRSEKGETAQQKQQRVRRADEQLAQSARSLSSMVLDPVAPQLANKRLVIVADGALQYIPFAMLPEPSVVSSQLSVAKNNGQRRVDQRQPLIVNHEVVSLPSASALAIQRAELAGRQPAPKMLAVIADPVFDRTDPRFKPVAPQSGTDASDKPQTQTTSADDARSIEHLAANPADKSGVTTLRLVIPRLPFTRQEASQLIALTPKGSSFSATDFQASRATVLDPALGQYRYVHFATHGFLDSERPGLSALVFSMVDAQGKPQDGFLRANDIYNLKLPAELVVLSACQTGLGKDIKGEGLVGLTRGFMYAGAARVVVSLWNVNDKATADLMTKFYEKMLKQGERPAAALRAAQVEMWKQKQWQSPYYWAAFTMQGEWR
jgi:CHAT domain-containing protein/predicted negative regulator of RcsB-dependent stress response